MDESNRETMEAEIQGGNSADVQGLPPSKRARYVIVNVLSLNKTTAIVEWLDKKDLMHSGYVPASAVIINAEREPVCAEGDLAAAAPYGIDWDKLPKTLSLEGVPNQLRQAHIYTDKDLAQRYGEVKRIAARTAEQIVRAIINLSKEN